MLIATLLALMLHAPAPDPLPEIDQRLAGLQQAVDARDDVAEEVRMRLALARSVRGWVEAERGDRANMRRLFLAFHGNQQWDDATLESAIDDHIDREIAELRGILDAAEAALDEDDGFRLPADWSRVEASTGRFRIDGRPVFPIGFTWYNEPEITEFHEARPLTPVFRPTLEPVLDRFAPMGVGMHEVIVRVSGFVGPGGEEPAAWFRDRLDLYAEKGMAATVLLHWTRTGEFEEAAPGIADKRGTFFWLDIDHPQFRPLAAQAIQRIVTPIAGHEAVAAYCLANEPEFYFNSWSGHTLAKFHAHLWDLYGDAAGLNAQWGTAFDDIEDVPLPDPDGDGDWSVRRTHDTLTFNRQRVTDMFTFVAEQVRLHDPEAVIHIKIQDFSTTGVRHHVPRDGLDRTALAELTDLHGIDTRILPVTDKRGAAPTWRDDRYTMLWLPGLMAYDHVRSIAPGQGIFDTEWHAFSTAALRPAGETDPSHARAALWLCATHGSTGNVVWYWQRRDQLDTFHAGLSHAFAGSLATRPALIDAMLAANIDLNRHAEAVAAIADAEPTVWIVLSDASWLSGEGEHMAAAHLAYEAAAQLGHKVGFITDAMWPDDLPAGPAHVLLPTARNLPVEAVERLTDGSLNVTRVHGGAGADAVELHVALAGSMPMPSVRLLDNERPAFGTLYRTVDDTTFITHVLAESRRVKAVDAEGRPLEGIDRLTGRRLSPDGFDLRPNDTLLVDWTPVD